MCEPIICGTVLTIYALGLGGMGLSAASQRKKEQLRWNLGDLVHRFQESYDPEGNVDVEHILREELKLGWQARRVIKSAHDARDQILFSDVPPDVKSAGKYVRTQKTVSNTNVRLLYILDPGLLLATLWEPLLMNSDLSSCRDGTYSTSVEFAASYRNLVGERAFHHRLEGFQHLNDIVETQPWYSERADYRSRLTNVNAEGTDSF
ncbi:hypothetical protein COY27_03325 [Candidatus Woesearchaeota archaeon CG_4_10_14_0_2_um_filter_33_13]|nr:MAG: hypothetical protein COY27_03325 [Candidatus Woesearchaeota archaeon CG_4_10_14_0_2_um_filter_33_13]